MKARIWATIAAGGVLILGTSAATAGPISGQGSWETTLQARDLDGDASTTEAYFDVIQGVTWLADANYAATSGYAAINAVEYPADEPGAPSGQHRDNIFSNGRMGWNAAMGWADGLVVGSYENWRLPSQSDWRSPDSVPDEMTSLRDITLGNGLFQFLTNTGPFSNVQGTNYWSATERASGRAYVFDFGSGDSYADAKYWTMYAWAVHDGDIGNPIPAAVTVPEPTSLALLGLGLFGIGIRRLTKA